MKNLAYINKNQSGQAMLLTVIFSLLLGLAMMAAIVTPVARGAQITSELVRSKQSFYLAESAVEDAIYRIKNGYEVLAGDTLVIDGQIATIVVDDSDFGGGKIVYTSGDWSESIRKIEAELIISEGSDFNYGVQAGNGGFRLEGGSTINGNVYANGNIIGLSGTTITGSAIAAGGAKIEGSGGSQWWQPLNVADDSWAYEVNYVNTGGDLYCQIGVGNAGQSCDTSRSNPPVAEFPISDSQIETWKSEAEAGGVTTGNVSVGWAGATLGPQKITGNLSVSGGGTLTLTGTIYVQGTVTVSGGGKIYLASSYGNKSGVLLSDGRISITGNGQFQGSGDPGSYPVVITTSLCPSDSGCSGNPALYLSGGSGAVILIAQNGTLNLNGGSAARSIIGETIRVSGGGIINYESGLADILFTSGPSGGFNILRWSEVQ